MKKGLYWEYRPEWSGWWLMMPSNGATATKGYGPFMTDFEIQIAADVHNVPFETIGA